MNQAVVLHKDLADRLVAALRQDEFILFGQAIVPFAPTGEERPFREILIRFQEEEDKLLPPGSFLPLLEEAGLMVHLDRWVVERVARRMRDALTARADRPVAHNSINLSIDTMYDPEFARFTREHIGAAELPAETLFFEVTLDNAIEHMEALQGIAAELRPAGCRFVIARFDGSREAFEALKGLAPEFIKISPGLVHALDDAAHNPERIVAINRRCQSLGIRTIAEHVESAQAIVKLRRIGVDFGQGFGLQEPLPLV